MTKPLSLHKEVLPMVEIDGGRMFTDQTIVIFDEEEACFGNILLLAQQHGWDDDHGDATTKWNPDDADNCEGDALFFLNSKSVWIFEKTSDGKLRQVY